VTAERLARARRVLDVETAGLAAVRERLDERFVAAVDVLLACRGKVVVTGVGKSGIVCRKIAATLASTGTPAFFLHAGEGGHGDLGTLERGDVLIAVSYNGESGEVLGLLPAARRLSLPLIAICGSAVSSLGRAADVVLDVGVPEEVPAQPGAHREHDRDDGDGRRARHRRPRGARLLRRGLRAPASRGGARAPPPARRGPHAPRRRAAPRPAAALLRDTLVEITSKRVGVAGVVDDAAR
jgi:arabinose-5-phosphate isomerase